MRKSLFVLRRVCRPMVVVAALLGSASVVVPVTAGAAPVDRLSAFDEQPNDQLMTHHKHLAVRQIDGYLFVANTVDDRVDVYRPTGLGAALVTSFGGSGVLTNPYGVAVDQASGTVYVSDPGHDQIVKYAPDGASFTRVGAPAFISPAHGGGAAELGGFAAALAVDPSTGDLLVADPVSNRVKRYGSDGGYKSSFAGDDASAPSPEGAFTGLMDLAVDSTGDVIVVDQNGDVTYGFGTSRAERFDRDGKYEASFAVTKPGTVAVRPNDEVVISGDQDSYNSAQNLSLHAFDTAATETGQWIIPGDINPSGGFNGSAGFYSNVTGIAVTGGPGQRIYAATDVDAVSGVYGAVSIQVYGIFVAGRPDATTGAATDIASQNAGLRGSVSPNGFATSYWFEYGTTTAYGSSIPSAQNAAAGDGQVGVDVSRFVNGLQPGTTYHYRLVAKNSLGTAQGDDRTFKTAEAHPTSVSASGRRFELVSPQEKGGYDVRASRSGIRASVDGNAVVYTSLGAFAGAPSMNTNWYRAARGSAGWSTQSISPPWFRPYAPMVEQRFFYFSPDLSRAAIWNNSPPLTSDAQGDTTNAYLASYDGSSASYRVVTPSGPHNANSDYYPAVADVSDDYQHVTFESTWPMTADAPDNGLNKLYEWVDGHVRLVGVLEDGSPAAGSFAGASYPSGRRGATSFVDTSDSMSGDGRRIYFTDDTTSQFDTARQLYLRQDGQTTVHVSRSRLTVPEPPAESVFWGASPDGSIAVFQSDAKLIEDAHASRNLYRYDANGDTIAAIGWGALGLLGMSTSGDTVYFASDTNLGDGAIGPPPYVYRWHDGDLSYVATMASSVTETCNWVDASSECGDAKSSRVSSDGNQLLFSSPRSLTGNDTGGTRQLYLYDAAGDKLTCVSCPPSGDPATAPSSSEPLNPYNSLSNAYENRSLSENGSRVIFNTAQALLPADTNHHVDVYLWENGALSLISTGKGGSDALFNDATPDGDSVFFVTRDRLVAADRDENMDLYVSRVGGGFADPAPAPKECEGEACQPPTHGADTSPSRPPSQEASAGDPAPVSRAAITVRSLTAKQRTTLARTGRVTLTASVTRPGTVSVLGAAQIGKRRATVIRVSGRAAKAGTLRLTLRLSSAARRQLSKKRKLDVALAVRFTGVREPRTSVIKLTKGR